MKFLGETLHFFDLSSLRAELRTDDRRDGLAWPYFLGTILLWNLGDVVIAFRPPEPGGPLGLIFSPRDVEIVQQKFDLVWVPIAAWIFYRVARELKSLAA